MWEAVLGYYIHMVYLVRNYTTTKNEGKVVQKKSSKDEKRGLSSFNLVQIQVGRIMKQQAFFGKNSVNFSWLQSRIVSRRLVAFCPIDIRQNSTGIPQFTLLMRGHRKITREAKNA